MPGAQGNKRGKFTTGEVCSSRELLKSNDRSAGEGWGWRERLENCFSCFSQGLQGNPGEAAAGLSGRSRPPSPPACPLRYPLRLWPPPPHAEGSAGLPPRSPALSRVLCRPFQGKGEGARRELLQWSTERTLPEPSSRWKASTT